MTNTRQYPAQVFWSEEDEGYIALATDLPGCSAFGATQEEALRELQDAIAAWIEAHRLAGNPVPPPSSPAHEYSGKVLVRMPKSLHARLATVAKIEDVSLNHYIVYLLSIGNERRLARSTTGPQLARQRDDAPNLKFILKAGEVNPKSKRDARSKRSSAKNMKRAL